jgi:hypothetical protein
MASGDTLIDLLQFEAPEDADPQQWSQAEKAALRFPERFLEKARELNECRQELNKAWEEKERLFGMVVRNLIDAADGCKVGLAGDAAPSAEPEGVARAALASVYRNVLHVLEELGVTPVDLLGRTYTDVVVDGEPVEDPFEVLESEQKGKGTEATVREVVSDLWVARRHGRVQVVRRGKVNC